MPKRNNCHLAHALALEPFLLWASLGMPAAVVVTHDTMQLLKEI